MINQALARKWRPKNFDTIVGQDFAIEAIKNSIKNQRIHHAYLFSGTRGVGKTTIARIFAKSLNCQAGVSISPCCNCSSCEEIDHSKAIDVIELDAASNTQVDNMRELMENANYQPTSSKYKVFIIDEVHMLSKSSFNAMLKTLEEPPEHVIFILATTDPEKIPVTVLSRCLHFSLLQMTNDEIIKQLSQIFNEEKISFDDKSLESIAKASEGSMRDALSLSDRIINFSNGNITIDKVEKVLGAVSKDTINKLIELIATNDRDEISKLLKNIQHANLSYEHILKNLAESFYQLSFNQTFGEIDSEILRNIEPKILQVFYQICIQGLKDISLAPNHFIGFSMTIIRLINFNPTYKIKSQPSQNIIEKKSEKKAPENNKLKNQNLPEKILSLVPSNWREMVEKLNNGMAKTLALNCELLKVDHNKLILAVDEKFSHLNNEKYIFILQQQLSEILSQKIIIEINVSEVIKTPASENLIEKNTAQKIAIDSIKADANLEQFINEFEGKIIEDTIKPIN
jgi:DNA polymerase-3 subunit gamma/tau